MSTAATAPLTSGPGSGLVLPVSSAGQFLALEVTSQVKAWITNPASNSGFAIGNTGTIAATCADRGHKIRIIHVPEDDNKAHAEIRKIPRDDLQLLERLAATVWAELVLNTAVVAGAKPAPDMPA